MRSIRVVEVDDIEVVDLLISLSSILIRKKKKRKAKKKKERTKYSVDFQAAPHNCLKIVLNSARFPFKSHPEVS